MKNTLLVLTAAVPFIAHAAAGDILVTKTADTFDGVCDAQDCSLREAIQLANSRTGPSRILLQAGTYQLTLPSERDEDGEVINEDANATGDLDVRGNIVIDGRGLQSTVIDGARSDRVFHLHPGASVEMRRIAIRNGRQPEYGGGLAVEAGATLWLRYCSVDHNIAGGSYFAAGFAGGIANFGTLTIDASILEGNAADHGDRGGSRPSQGGAIYNGGSLTVRETRFIGNRARDRDDAGFGGAIYNDGTAAILRSGFETNSVDWQGSGTTLLNRGTLRLENSTVTGGSLEDVGRLLGTLTNGTPNDAVPAVMRLVNVTIADNLAHGIVNYGRLDVLNSIVAGNGDKFTDIVEANCINVGPNARFTQRGLLRAADDFTNCEADIIVPSDSVFTTLLYPLALNNWNIPTFALRKRSPAVDAAVGECPSTDQRRVTRPRDGDGDGVALCDVGAYERPKP